MCAGNRRMLCRRSNRAFPRGASRWRGASARVLEQFTAGASNKEAGRHLGISPRTIEDHRANIMKKLGARNAADLVRIVMTTQRQGQI